jgi:hypothetical protein
MHKANLPWCLRSANCPAQIFTCGIIEHALFLHTRLMCVHATLKCRPGLSASAAIMFELRGGLPKIRPRREMKPDADAELA